MGPRRRAFEARVAAIDALGNLARSTEGPEAVPKAVDPDETPTLETADEAATPWLSADGALAALATAHRTQ